MNDFTTNAGIVGGCMFLVAFTACVGLTPFVVAWKLRERKETQRNRRIDTNPDAVLFGGGEQSRHGRRDAA